MEKSKAIRVHIVQSLLSIVTYIDESQSPISWETCEDVIEYVRHELSELIKELDDEE